MRARQYVAYYRVSTRQQGSSGLGLEAQRAAIGRYLNANPGKLAAEFTEVGSGFKGARPALAEALRTCRMRRAVLLIGRLDRLARNVATIAGLMDNEVEFVAVDFPQATRLTLHVLAAIAEYESRLASERVKAGIAAARARGVIFRAPHGSADMRAAVAASVRVRKAKALARARDIEPLLRSLIDDGRPPGEIAAEFNRLKIATPRRRIWDSDGVRRVLRLLGGPPFQQARSDWRSVRDRARWAPLAPLIWGMRRDGLSLDSIAGELNRRGVPTARNGRWASSTVQRILRATAPLMGEPEGCGRVFSRVRWAKAHRRASELAPLILALRAQGKTLREIAREFNERGIRTARGGRWSGSSLWETLSLDFRLRAEANPERPPEPFHVSRLDQQQRAMRVAPQIWALKAVGNSTAAIADELNRLAVRPPKCGRWRARTVKRVLSLTAQSFPDLAKAAAEAPNPWLIRARARSAEVAPIVRDLTAAMTAADAAAELTRRGVATPGGGRFWYVGTVRLALSRAAEWAQTTAGMAA